MELGTTSTRPLMALSPVFLAMCTSEIPTDSCDLPPTERRRRFWVRLSFLVIASALILDVCPWWPLLNRPKQALSSVLNRIGLCQGEWPLFAPNPIVDNGWFSADLTDKEGNRFTWNSPHWVQTNSWDRFYKFRHLNFYNRLHLLHNAPAVNDFSDYLARTISTDPKNRTVDITTELPKSEPNPSDRSSPVREVKVYKISKLMMLTEEGTLPTRDETIWTLRTELLSKKEYSE